MGAPSVLEVGFLTWLWFPVVSDLLGDLREVPAPLGKSEVCERLAWGALASLAFLPHGSPWGQS